MDHVVEVRVLIVDDDQANLAALQRSLTHKVREVLVASSVAEGLKIIFQQKNDGKVIHVLFTDLRMPERDGIDFLRNLKIYHPEIPVVLITGFGTVSQAVESMKLGAFDFLEKPITRERILQIIEKVLKVGGISKPESVGEILSFDSLDLDSFESPAMKQLDRLTRQLAQSASMHIHISGESGSGKEWLARKIVKNSSRANKPFIQIHCGAMPDSLLESELFGHEKGAFTGAHASKIGLFEAADGGTVLLDEVGEMSPLLQVKLLRFLQDGVVRKVGSTLSRKVDVRILSATHKDLAQLVERGLFREDLRFRLEVLNLKMPALRERKEDFKILLKSVLDEAMQKLGLKNIQVSARILHQMGQYPWPGNVRELQNCVERSLIWLNSGEVLTHLEGLQTDPQASDSPWITTEKGGGPLTAIPVGTTLKDLEDLMIRKTLDATQGDKVLAARLLGIHAKTITRKFRSPEV